MTVSVVSRRKTEITVAPIQPREASSTASAAPPRWTRLGRGEARLTSAIATPTRGTSDSTR
jgi:hypothetical protein